MTTGKMTGLRQYTYIGGLVALTLSLDDMDFVGAEEAQDRVLDHIAEEDRRDTDGSQGAVTPGARGVRRHIRRALLFIAAVRSRGTPIAALLGRVARSL
jgi:hypothetical protein